MKNYYRVMLGRKSTHAAECFRDGCIGADFTIDEDLTRKLPDQWRDFNKAYIPIFISNNPGKSKITAGLACGALWTIAKGIKQGDIVLSPDGSGTYKIGEVLGEYYYAKGNYLPHRRKVRWLNTTIDRSAMSEALQNSTGSIGTVSHISGYRDEIEKLIAEAEAPVSILTGDNTIEDPYAFAMEKHLEDFLVKNWNQTELSKEFTIFEEEGEPVGQQYDTDAGSIDILAISKNKKKLLVVELKKGRATDVVVGQVLRYMGYVKDQIAEPDQTVEGAIIAFDDDQKLKWALMSVPSITFYRYQISFKLIKG
jgi:restriction system protein